MRTHALVVVAVVAFGCGPQQAGFSLQPHEATREALRPTDTSSSLMWRFNASDVVETYGSDGGSFLVHYTRAGSNAVPSLDADDSGVPDFVEAVDQVYESVGALYHGPLGYRRPLSDEGFADNGGDGRFDIYLIDFGLSADGAFRVDQCPTAAQCMGYVVQENDFAGYGYPSATVATRILGSHEYFHAVQAAYSNLQDVVVSEGTAVWATETFDPSLDDFEGFIGGYLERPDRSLDSPPPGPVPSFAYGSGLFFKFLTERYEPAVIRKLWEHLEPGKGDPSEPANVSDPTWLVQLDALLTHEYQSSFSQAFAEFGRWNLELGAAAVSDAGFANAATYPDVTATELTLPAKQESLRVYYASAQYFRASVGGRSEVVAALIDSPSTHAELGGLELVVTTRQARRTLQVQATQSELTTGLTVQPGAADEVLVGVVNTHRGANGALLSLRPSLCVGTRAEVNACHAALDPSFDAGVPVENVGDAGVVTEPSAKSGCGCSSSDGGWVALAAVAMVLLRRRQVA
jgi:MYXO-CTERM domain-containing protein